MIFFDSKDLINQKSMEERCNIFHCKIKKNHNCSFNNILKIFQYEKNRVEQELA
jgi:hypothetical protein